MAKPGATGVTRIINATGYSMKGLKSAWINEAAFRQELVLVLALMPLAGWLGDSLNEILLLICISWLVVIVEVLNSEIAAGRLEKNFTFQSGVGGVANAVLTDLIQSGFKDLRMYSELMTDIAIKSMVDGTISEATTTGISVTGDTYETFINNLDYYKKHLVIRPVDMTNNGELIRRMGVVSMNTIVEGDIYGNVNSSHAMGSHIINGVGGSNDFARHSKLAIFQTPSTARGGAISSIVPMVTHVDNTEHDVDVLVTEQGWADLRGKTPKQRAQLIIDHCTHPDYREALQAYFDEALALCGPCQTPHNLEKALSWHVRFLQTGSMKEKTEA